MKYLIRYSSVLLCFLLLFTVFSVSVSAEENITPEKVYFTRYTEVCNDWQCSNWLYSYPSDTESGDFVEYKFQGNAGIPANTKRITMVDKFVVQSHDKTSALIQKGDNTTLSLYNIYLGAGINHPNGFYYLTGINYREALVIYMDGTSEYIETIDNFKVNGQLANITFTFKPKQNVKAIEFWFERTKTNIVPVTTQAIDVSAYFGMSATATTYMVVQSTEEAGLLRSIIDWIKDIAETISRLPERIADFILGGLQSLFVPSEDYIIQFKEDMNLLLYDRFGAVYQSVDILAGSWDRITANNEQNIIKLPLTTINLPEGNTFSFGGYDVKIVPDGFEFLTDVLKVIIGILSTLAFVNGMRKKYDEVMGVEQ